MTRPLLEGRAFKDMRHPENPDRTLLGDMEKLAERYHNSAQTLHGEKIYDMRDIGRLRKHLKEEYRFGEKDRWFENLKKGQFRTIRREKKKIMQDADEATEAKFSTEYDGQSAEQTEEPKQFKAAGGRKPKGRAVTPDNLEQRPLDP